MKPHVKAIAQCFLALFLVAAAPAWDASPWLADLAQIRAAIDNGYPNRDWLTGEREVSLDRWFERAADSIRASHGDADARRVLDRLITRFNDGHVVLSWPSVAAAQASAGAGDASPGPASSLPAFCAARGFDAGRVTAGTAAALPGYRKIDGGGPFQAGVVQSEGKTIGIVRIGVFSPQGYPATCEAAVARLRISVDAACDAACDDRVMTQAHAILTQGLISTIERLRAEGAQVLMVDLTQNGGGTEWAEAAARIVSPLSLRSAPVAVLRGEAWVRRWHDLAIRLRTESMRATRADRAVLLDYAGRAQAISNGLKPCGEPACSRLAPAGYASGLLAERPAGQLDGKAWAADVFSPAQYPYRDSVWKGPLIVLVDSETWSAAEQFAALLQDNEAAVIMGTRTGGAGCGHLGGNDPITLTNSKATLELPNCVRLRKDGSNEVSGVIPDVSTGVRANDGPAFAGHLSMARLPQAAARAEALRARQEYRPGG
ncbi:MAG: hypothetical protein K2X68_00455 [Novosphingobium sp.]|nr:hypothetical protein [Novosphingobium sp.]